MTKYTLTRTSKFEKNLLEHLAFLANVSEKAAISLLNNAEKAILSLPDNPFMYKIIHNNVRRIVLDKRYAILYEIIANDIVVLSMYDCRMQEY